MTTSERYPGLASTGHPSKASSSRVARSLSGATWHAAATLLCDRKIRLRFGGSLGSGKILGSTRSPLAPPRRAKSPISFLLALSS